MADRDSRKSADHSTAEVLMRAAASSGNRQVAAAVASALWRLSATPDACEDQMSGELVKRLVDRISLIMPSLAAQVISGMHGASHHRAHGLVPPSAVLNRNCALHADFASDTLLGDLSASEKRRLQRGTRKHSKNLDGSVVLQDAPVSKAEARMADDNNFEDPHYEATKSAEEVVNRLCRYRQRSIFPSIHGPR